MEAEADLVHGVDEVERQRSEVWEPEERALFLAGARSLFDELIALQVDALTRPGDALATLERAENRLYLDTLGASSADAVRCTLPALDPARLTPLRGQKQMFVRYGQMRDRLLLWVLKDGEVRFEQRTLDVETLKDRVARYHKALQTGHTEDAATLGRWLVAQVLPSGFDPSDFDELLLVPSGPLLDLPFAALPIGDEGEPLVARVTLSYAPSLISLQLAEEAASASVERASKALFVADPAFPQHLFPHLEPLPAARSIVETLSAEYPSAQILSGSAATIEALVAALPEVRLLHVGGHGLTDPLHPDRGGLLLAARADIDDPAAALFTAANLGNRRFPGLELVVFDACSTAFGTYPDTAEITGLAAAFLARGVRRVLTTIWAVEDDRSARFFALFHHHLATGSPPEQALRQTQLDCLRSVDPDLAAPVTWAGFQVIRGAFR